MFNVIELMINKTLAIDPRSKARLEKLEKTCLKIEITSLAFLFFVEFKDQKIHLSKHSTQHLDKPNNPDITITGSLTAFTSLVLQKDQKNALPQGLAIEGDTERAEMIKNLFLNLDIDWEEILSHWTGDIMAHQVGCFFRNLKTSQKTFFKALNLSTSQYLLEEAKITPTKIEMNEFLGFVDNLRNETERLEARINFLEYDNTMQGNTGEI